MRSILFAVCFLGLVAAASLAVMATDEALAGKDVLFPAELVRFTSPDGKLALFMGWDEERHYDASSEYGWVVDKKMQPGGIIALPSQKILLAFDAPGRPDEDRALWSTDSTMLAYSHRGNKRTELRLFSFKGDSVRELKLPYLGEVELKMKPHRREDSSGHEHLNRDEVVPVRWIESRALVVSQELSITDTAEESVTDGFRVVRM